MPIFNLYLWVAHPPFITFSAILEHFSLESSIISFSHRGSWRDIVRWRGFQVQRQLLAFSWIYHQQFCVWTEGEWGASRPSPSYCPENTVILEGSSPTLAWWHYGHHAPKTCCTSEWDFTLASFVHSSPANCGQYLQAAVSPVLDPAESISPGSPAAALSALMDTFSSELTSCQWNSFL